MALSEAVETFLRRLLQQVNYTDLYAVGLYTSGELNYLVPTANATSAWTRSKGSKWSPADWTFHLYAIEAFKTTEKVLIQGWNEDFSTFDVDQARMRQLIHRVLLKARERYLYGSSAVVGLFMGEMGSPWVRESVVEVNPPHVVHAFDSDLSTQWQE